MLEGDLAISRVDLAYSGLTLSWRLGQLPITRVGVGSRNGGASSAGHRFRSHLPPCVDTAGEHLPTVFADFRVY